jgi:nicotinamide-nucleotide amidase
VGGPPPPPPPPPPATALRAKIDGMIYGENAEDLAALTLNALRTRQWTIGFGESCTGGLFGARLTAIPGSSDVVRGGIVAYSNDLKVARLGVPASLIDAHGAVSLEVARAMATGAREATGATVGVGITGIAGPGGGSPEKPVGLVCIAADLNGSLEGSARQYVGDREEVRRRSTQAALLMVQRHMSRA